MTRFIFLRVPTSFLMVFLFASLSSAEDFIERVYEGESKKTSLNEARQEIYDNATQSVAEEAIKEYIGEEKLQRNRTLIRSRIVRQYSKFIPFIKPEAPRIEGESTKMTVTMRVSLKNLQDMLLKNGLMYEDDGAPVVIPMIHLVDRRSLKTHKWWISEISEPSVKRFVQNLMNKMREEFFKRGFYLLNPVTFNTGALLSSDQRFDRPRIRDWQQYGQIFQSQIVVYGPIEIQRDRKVKIKLSAVHSSNGRIIAGVSRTFDIGNGPYALAQSMNDWAPKISSDLSVQILEAWQRGTFGSQLLTIRINRKLNEFQLNAFKSKLLSKSKKIKSIKDRFFDPEYIKLEMDVTKAPSQFVPLFKDFEFMGLSAEVESYGSNSIVLNVK